jgi:hypothetical protein
MNINWPTARRWLGLALTVAALAVAGCGGSSSSKSSSSSRPAATSTSGGSSSSSGIPQGPNAGDKDADNQGGPSDGDGNI